jgi:hypothetical protein
VPDFCPDAESNRCAERIADRLAHCGSHSNTHVVSNRDTNCSTNSLSVGDAHCCAFAHPHSVAKCRADCISDGYAHNGSDSGAEYSPIATADADADDETYTGANNPAHAVAICSSNSCTFFGANGGPNCAANHVTDSGSNN